MPNIFKRPASTGLISFILSLPVAVVFSMLVLKQAPSFGPVLNPPTHHPEVSGSLLALGLFLLLPLAFVIVSVPIRQTVHVGGCLLAHRVNVALAALILILIVMVVGSIIADQYPCWIGVPNCD